MKKILLATLSLSLVLTGCSSLSVEDAKVYAETFTDNIESGATFEYNYSDEDGYAATISRDSNSNYAITYDDTTDIVSIYIIDGTVNICTNTCLQGDISEYDINSYINDYINYVLDTFSGDYDLEISEEEDYIEVTVPIYYEDESDTDGYETYKIQKDGNKLTLSFECTNSDACYSYEETTTLIDVEDIVLP